MPMPLNGTVFDAVLASLHAAAHYDRNDQEPPAVVLWTDRDGQWQPLLPRIRAALPQLLALGAYDPATRTGPAIWLRPMLARALPEAAWPADAVPILYLPGVSRLNLRAVEDCPKDLQPLAELQYRGTFWTQANTNDWTIAAFLSSAHGGLGLDLARDAATITALRDALVELVDQPISALQGKRIDAEFLRELLIQDPEREMLRWLDDPVGTRARWDDGRWNAFRSLAIEQYGFDPERDGAIVGAEQLGYQQGAWRVVWKRFAEAPQHYAALPNVLRRAKPAIPDVPPKPGQANLFAGHSSSWPQDNEVAETALRNALADLQTGTPAACRMRVRELEAAHAERRSWVWAALGRAPLAAAQEHLATLAELAATPLAGATPVALAEAYSRGGWRVDAAAIDAMALVEKPDDVAAVRTAILAVYKPWLEDTAERFQQAAAAQPLPRKLAAHTVLTVPAGCCVLFADGLRFDVGRKLRAALAAEHLQVQGEWRCSTLPSATPTAKPAASPIAALFGIQALLEAGWKQVRVVTDHGWLLLPGGLPKQELPSFLTESRWGRCATLKPNAEPQGTIVPWYWSDAVQIAVPNGIACYKAGTEYAHGGMSLQECVVPVLTISSATAGTPTVTIQSVKWRGLRCQVQVSKDAANLIADVRTSTNDAASSLLEAPKTIPESGVVSLPVIDDSKEGAASVVVVLSGNGVVLAKMATTVGGSETDGA